MLVDKRVLLWLIDNGGFKGIELFSQKSYEIKESHPVCDTLHLIPLHEGKINQKETVTIKSSLVSIAEVVVVEKILQESDLIFQLFVFF